MSEPTLVVGALIVDSLESPTRILAARRTGPPELAGRWEFPGGKVERHETPQEALRRELEEELSVRVEVSHELLSGSGESWPISDQYVMRLFYVIVQSGTVVPNGSHDAVRWLAADELSSVEWLDSDLQALPKVFGGVANGCEAKAARQIPE